MITNIRNLKKIHDILNSEGTILGLYQYMDKFCLSSYLTDNSGTVYYTVEESTLFKYFNNELRLCHVFLASEDTIVVRKDKMETVYLIKQDLTDLISCGDQFYSENSDAIRNDNIIDLFIRK